MPSDEDPLWTFDRFEPGHVFGKVDIPMDEGKKADWSRVFGETGPQLPRGMLVTAMMDAYIRAIQPRPGGNVHASQALSFTNVSASWGDTLSIEVSCADKIERKGRFWVDFGIIGRVSGAVVMHGTIRSIWAA